MTRRNSKGMSGHHSARPRTEFTKATKRKAFTRSSGICECHRVPKLKRPHGCGVALSSAQA